jgi:His-Xaa-Ser system protein HxsD
LIEDAATRQSGTEVAPMADDSVTIRIDLRVYPLEVVQRAAFRCTDIASFDFSIVAEHDVDVTATTKSALSIAPGDVTARFHNELLDQKLRQTVADETRNERDLILAYAFSNTKLLG